jgi:hypothetical protein
MDSRAEHTPVGTVTARTVNPTTRRGTPWQERSPFDLWPTATAVTAAPSQGNHPAHTRHAISTREHQKGGAPTRTPLPRCSIIRSRKGASRALRVAARSAFG